MSWLRQAVTLTDKDRAPHAAPAPARSSSPPTGVTSATRLAAQDLTTQARVVSESLMRNIVQSHDRPIEARHDRYPTLLQGGGGGPFRGASTQAATRPAPSTAWPQQVRARIDEELQKQ
jgi:hypothetical protein